MLTFGLTLIIALTRVACATAASTYKITEHSFRSLVTSLGSGSLSISENQLSHLTDDEVKTDGEVANSINYLIKAISSLLGANTPQNRTVGQLNLALASRAGNNLATGIFAYAYQGGRLGYPHAETIAHFLYHDLIDTWVFGSERAYPYEYTNVHPLQIAKYGTKHEAETFSSAEREFMVHEAGSDPDSGQALAVLVGFLAGEYGFPKNPVLLARFAAIGAIVDGTGQNGEPGLFDLANVNSRLQKYFNQYDPDEHVDGYYRTIPTMPSLDLYKYRANLALSNHAFIEAIVQIVRASEALLISEYPELFNLPKNITYTEYLANPDYNIKTSNSTLVREAIQIYLKRSKEFVPFVAAISSDLLRRTNSSYEEYAKTLITDPWLIRSPKETCTRRGQAFGIIASSLFSKQSVPDEYASSTFILQATRILYLMAVHNGCHMGLAGLAYHALAGYHIPAEDYLGQETKDSHMYPVTHYASLSSSTLQAIGTMSFIPAKLVGFTTVRRLSSLDLMTPRVLEALMALDVASISGNFEASFYLSLLLSRKMSEFSVRSFGLNYLWYPPITALLEERFENLSIPAYKNCESASLDFYGMTPINMQLAGYLANHSATVGNLGGQIAAGYFLYTGQSSSTDHGNTIWNVAVRRILTRNYISLKLKHITNWRVSAKREILGAYLANGMMGCYTSLKNSVKMILSQSHRPFSLHRIMSLGYLRILGRKRDAHSLDLSDDLTLLPNLTMYGYGNRQYSATGNSDRANIYFSMALLANFCTVEDPGCAILMAKTIKRDREAALDALLGVDITADDLDYKSIGTTLYNILTANGTLTQYYIKHRLGVVSPKYSNAVLLRNLGLRKHSQELANVQRCLFACKLKGAHEKLVKYYSTIKTPYKHIISTNSANSVTKTISLLYNLFGITYSFVDMVAKLVENNIIKRMLRMLDMAATLLYMRLLTPIASILSICKEMMSIGGKLYRFGTSLMRFFVHTASSQTQTQLPDLDLQARVQTVKDDGPLTIQGQILGGNYHGTAPNVNMKIFNGLHDSMEFSHLLDNCYMIPYLLSHHGEFTGSHELLQDHLEHLPYCLQLTSILSTESAHVLFSFYNTAPSKKTLTEFAEQDVQQYLSELDNALLNIQLRYKLPEMNYLINYAKGVLPFQKIELGYETRRNREFRSILAYQSDQLMHLFSTDVILPSVSSLPEFKTMMRAAFNKLAHMITMNISDSHMPLGNYPQIYWDSGLDFNWQLLDSINYVPLFTVQTLILVILTLKKYSAFICTALGLLYYLTLYDTFFSRVNIHTD